MMGNHEIERLHAMGLYNACFAMDRLLCGP
jgi:hypothetical protein